MDGTTRTKKRQRAILSCNDCRRRKLKCDRLSPCNRCIKGGIADSCAYGPEAHSVGPEERQHRLMKKRRVNADQPPRSITEEETFASESERDVFDRVGGARSRSIAQSRIEQLERNAALGHQDDPSQEEASKDQVEFLVKSPELKGVSCCTMVKGMLKGRSYGTHFYGSSSAMSVVALFPDLRAFMKEAYSESTARRLSQDIKASEDRARSLRPHHRILRIRRLRDLLPDRFTVDTLLQRYFDTFETTFRVIHIPTFKTAYGLYWKNQESEDVDMDALILAILACTICTSTHDSLRYNHSGSSFHSKAVVWIRACEAWLRRQSNKHRSLVSLQVRCLRILTLSTSSLKVKEYYQEVQAHIALLRSTGMHRDPSIFGAQCSAFEGEMRRRLWATTVELELQASIDKGTSSMLSLDHDCTPPRNVDDVELHPDMEALPQSCSINIYTDAAFLNLSMQTSELRISLCAKVNSLRRSSDFQGILKYEDLIRQSLKEIPRWTDPRSGQTRNLLDLQLRQFLVILHASRALKPESCTTSDCRYSIFTCLEAAAKTIEVHNNMIEASNYALLLTSNDYFRAMLLICHIAYHARKANDSAMMRFAKQLFDDCVDKALRLQEERAVRPGRGIEYYWYISAAVNLVRKQFKPSQSELLKQQAIDRIAKMLYKFLSLQDEPDEMTLATEVILEEPPDASLPSSFALHTPANPLTIDDFSNAGLQLDAFSNGLGDTPEWMDDLWFFNVPPLYFNGQSHTGF